MVHWGGCVARCHHHHWCGRLMTGAIHGLYCMHISAVRSSTFALARTISCAPAFYFRYGSLLCLVSVSAISRIFISPRRVRSFSSLNPRFTLCRPLCDLPRVHAHFSSILIVALFSASSVGSADESTMRCLVEGNSWTCRCSLMSGGNAIMNEWCVWYRRCNTGWFIPKWCPS